MNRLEVFDESVDKLLVSYSMRKIYYQYDQYDKDKPEDRHILNFVNGLLVDPIGKHLLNSINPNRDPEATSRH